MGILYRFFSKQLMTSITFILVILIIEQFDFFIFNGLNRDLKLIEVLYRTVHEINIEVFIAVI